MEGDKEYNDREEIFSKVIRAGKRTYFFDVKSTRGNDLYLTLTESKKRYDDSGEPRYEKHKIFLYKEDFDKFQDGFQEALDKIEHLKDSEPKYKEAAERIQNQESSSEEGNSYSHTEW